MSPVTNDEIEHFLLEKHLNIEAVKYPIPNLHNSYKDSDGNLVIPAKDIETGFYSINDASNGNIFNTGVKKNYEILQYMQSFSALQDIAKVTDLKLVDGGIWNKGAEAFISFDLPGTIEVGNRGDRIAKRLTAISSHSSVFSFIMLITPLRLWCKNQIPAMFVQAKKEQVEGLRTMLKIRHTPGGKSEIENIGEWLDLVNGQFKLAEERYNRLAEIKITDKAMIAEVFSKLFKVNPTSERSKTMVKNQITNAVESFLDSDGGLVETMTAWNLANSLQGSFQHKPSRKTETHDKSVLVGSIARKGREAFQAVMEVCSNPQTDPSKYKVDADIEGMLSGITL